MTPRKIPKHLIDHADLLLQATREMTSSQKTIAAVLVAQQKIARGILPQSTKSALHSASLLARNFTMRQGTLPFAAAQAAFSANVGATLAARPPFSAAAFRSATNPGDMADRVARRM